MHDLFSHCLLLAARSRLDNLSQPFKGHAAGIDRGDVTRALAILTVAVVLVWLLSRLRVIQERQRRYNSPWRLFFSLCRAHELPWSQRWLLWRLARARRLKPPARLFLEPQWFEAAGLGPAWRSRAAELKSLRDRLFADAPAGAGQETEQRRRQGKRAAASGPAAPGPALDIAPWPASLPTAPAPSEAG
ncbi:MAG: hypothetical protein ACLQLG_01690 [Thermoguttaceae bacterium]